MLDNHPWNHGTHQHAEEERLGVHHFAPVPAEQQKYAGLQTSTGNVKFRKQYADFSSLPFILCERAADGIKFRPYDLTVVDNASIARQDYFHVSADGIIRIVGGDHFEHISLRRWDEERVQFDHLRQLGFFRKFLIGRAFNTWRRVIRRQKFECLRQRIADRLFLGKPEFLRGLQEISRLATTLTAIQLIPIPVPGNHYEIDHWADLQTSNREQHATPALDAFLKTVEQEAENVCRLIGRRAREWAQSVRDLSELADDTGVEMLVRQHRPMVMIKAEKLERARMFKQVMEDARLMGNFVRLADIMVTEALASHVIISVQQLLAALEASNTVGTFITTVSFTSGGAVQCSPDGFSVADTIITNAVEGTVALVSGCARLVRGRSFVPFYDEHPAALSISSIIRDNLQYRICCADIEKVVMSDFERAHHAAALLKEHRAALVFCSTLTEEISLIRTKADIQDNLRQVSSWHAGILNLSEGVTAGCLHVDSRALRMLLQHSVEEALSDLKAHAVVLASSACMECLLDIHTRILALTDESQHMSFEELQVIYTAQREQHAAVLRQAEEVDELYSLLAAYGQRAPTADQVKHDDLREAVLQLHKVLSDNEAHLALLSCQTENGSYEKRQGS